MNEDGTIPSNRSFINVKTHRIVRYYDINRVITKTIKYYINPSQQVSQICLFKNGKLNDDGDTPAITTYHHNGKIHQKMWYKDNECTSVKVCNEPVYGPPRNGDLVYNKYIEIKPPSAIE